MLKKSLTLKNKLGLHARAAALFVQTAGKFKSKITVIKENQPADGKSIMGLMILAAECGSVLTITAEGSDEKEALTALEDLISRKFNEPE